MNSFIHCVLKWPVYLVFCLTISAVISTNQSKMTEAQLNPSEVQVLEGNALFTKEMYQTLSSQEGNIFFSPISAHAVLSMTYLGSRGSTKEAFEKCLKITDINHAALGYENVMQKLNNVENVTLSLANKIYLKENYNLQSDFESAVTKSFQSEVEKINFSENEKAANKINGWVENKTNEKIKNLIDPSMLDNLTRLVLVNAIYFKGDWNLQFKKERTTKQPFYVKEGEEIEVDMMTQTNDFQYKQDDDLKAQILEMKYKNKDFSMVIILPNDKYGIKQLEEKLAAADLKKVMENMRKREIVLSLPKFKIETKMRLNENLEKMGLGEIFSDKCDLSGLIDGGEPLQVTEVIQKAFLEVNEEGAEAAAATGVIVRKTRACVWTEEKPIFKADHQFIFYILTQENCILFKGKLRKPIAATHSVTHMEL